MWLKIRSKNTSCAPLRKCIKTKKPVVLRLGSTTPLVQIFKKHPEYINKCVEINSIEGCIISGNKYKMKTAFDEAEVKTAKWKRLDEYKDGDLKFPLIIKHIHSSKGKGIYYAKDKDELDKYIKELQPNTNYIVEEYKTFVREYRLHVTKDGCFYTCRKMLKEDAEVRWHRHEENCVWILEDNELFDKPNNWDDIVAECIKAMKACKLDICAVDIKVQSNQKKNPDFIILETNSAPALGEIGIEKYKQKLTEIVNEL